MVEEFGRKVVKLLSELSIYIDTTSAISVAKYRISQSLDTFVISSDDFVLSNEMLSRVAITYGKVFHNGNRFIGLAINRAYEMEQKEAIYPRIIIDEIALLKADYHCEKLNERDFDGFCCSKFDFEQQIIKPHKETIQTFIKESFIEYYNKVSLCQKYYYLVKKFFTEEEVEKITEEAKNKQNEQI